MKKEFKETDAKAPFKKGSVPVAGWFCIETTFRHRCPNLEAMLSTHGLEPPVEPGEQLALAAEHGLDVEIATEGTLKKLAEAFAAVDAEGRGVLLTRDHAGLAATQDSRACGWIRALHAEGGKLWAWIELTPYGHGMVNNGEFVYFSTEYDYADFRATEGGAEPGRLTGCTLTNMPRHAAQTPCTNMCKPPASAGTNPEDNTMDTEPNKKEETAATNEETEATEKTQGNCATTEGTKPETAKAGNEEATEESTAANSDGEEQAETATNDETTGESLDMESAAVAIAELLELPETATPADLLEAVKKLASSNEELRAALAEANKSASTEDGGVASNSKRYPHLCMNSKKPSRTALKGGKPNGTTQVRVNGQQIAVNTQEKSRADYCTNAIAKAERELGRKMTPAEFNKAYAKANADYTTGANR